MRVPDFVFLAVVVVMPVLIAGVAFSIGDDRSTENTSLVENTVAADHYANATYLSERCVWEAEGAYTSYSTHYCEAATMAWTAYAATKDG